MVSNEEYEKLRDQADAYRAEGKLDEALMCYEQALELAPKNPEALKNVGRAYGDLEQLDNAVEYYLKALALDDAYWRASHNLSIVLRKQEKYDKALEYGMKALEYTDILWMVHNSLGNLFDDIGDEEKASSHFQKALKNSNVEIVDIAPLFNYARYLHSREIYADAIIFLERVRSHKEFECALDDAQKFDVYDFLFFNYLALHIDNDDDQYIERIISNGQKTLLLHEEFGFIKKSESLFHLYRTLAILLVDSSDYELMSYYLKQALAIDKAKEPELFAVLANVYMEIKTESDNEKVEHTTLNYYQLASENFEAYLDMVEEPKAFYIYRMAKCWDTLKEYDKIIRVLEPQFNNVDEEDAPWVAQYIATAYREMGNKDMAKKYQAISEED